MIGLVKTKKGKGNLELQDVPIPEPGENEVRIRVSACGICGTDVHVRDDHFPYWPPVVLGHEFTGVVDALGPGTTLVAEGDRVVGEPHTQACGHCTLCRTGNPQICATKRSPGWGINGAFTEYLVMPEHLLHKLPDNVDDVTGAIIEPTANTVHDVIERATIEAGDFVVVIGPGPIGLLAALTARAGGARNVMVIGAQVDEALRLPKAREMGFEHVVNAQDEDAEAKVMELTDALGADLIVECSGSAKGIASTVGMVRKKGRICAIGLPEADMIDFPYKQAAFKVCDFHFCLSTSHTSWNKTIHLMATGQLPVAQVITHKFPLEQWEDAFAAIDNREALKVVLVP